MRSIRINRYVKEITRIFKTTPDKRLAHERSRPILEDISTDRDFFATVLWNYLSRPEVLNNKNRPEVAMNVELNPYYHLFVNCWIPLLTREGDVSSKSIHHHGIMLLSTTTIFGPGYEHWLFTRPQVIDPERELYAMDVTSRKPHPKHDTAFVDAFEPHLPMYPTGLTLTLNLWSHRHRTTWRDYVKRIPWLKRYERALRPFLFCPGITSEFARFMDVNVIRYFDYCPTEEGFRGMRDRLFFPEGPNEDYLQSLFHIIQGTGNDRVVPLMERHLEAARVPFENVPLISGLLHDLKRDRTIEGRLSACHIGLPNAFFKSQDIEQTLSLLRSPERRPTAVGTASPTT